MTIFDEIAKQCVGTEIQLILDASLAADQSYANGALSFFGFGRNNDLSTAKRQLLAELLKQIHGLSEHESQDQQRLTQFAGLIKICKQATEVKSAGRGYDAGAVGPALEKLNTLLQTIFDKLTAFNLLDITHDANPFNAFRYYVARYFSNRIIRASKHGDLERFLENPQISLTRTLMAEKEACIIRQLAECESRLNDLDQSRPNYKLACVKLVLEEISNLQRENLAVYTRHPLQPGMPMRLGFLGVAALPKAQPAGGTLDEALRQATAEITRTKETLESAVKAPMHPA